MAFWLVTGGCGFIGSYLVEALLRRGDRVRVIDDLSGGKRYAVPQNTEVVIGDVADRSVLKAALADVDGCFHLAAVASVPRCDHDWQGGLHSNVVSTISVLDAARTAGASPPLPVVYASSAAVYGDNPSVPLGETAATSPLSIYGEHKLLAELYAKAAWSLYWVPTVGLRLFNVYGARQDPQSPYSGVISIFFDRLGAGKAIDIFGDGHQIRDFVYVGDVVEHLLAAMARLREGAQIFNVCTGRSTSVRELAGIIGGLYGRAPTIHFRRPRYGDIRMSLGDPSAAVAYLRVAAATRLEDGLRRTLQGSAGGK